MTKNEAKSIVIEMIEILNERAFWCANDAVDDYEMNEAMKLYRKAEALNILLRDNA